MQSIIRVELHVEHARDWTADDTADLERTLEGHDIYSLGLVQPPNMIDSCGEITYVRPWNPLDD
jgi:hypothetical protein